MVSLALWESIRVRRCIRDAYSVPCLILVCFLFRRAGSLFFCVQRLIGHVW